jgi:hypothetical protein
MNSEQVSRKSFYKINYYLRTRKQIERKIIIEILNSLPGIRNFHYLGMGSITYYDFILFHKYLQIANMTSLDAAKTVKRFAFNKPYDFITFINANSTEFLEEYDFSANQLIWLDYDSQFYDFSTGVKYQPIFDDISLIIANANPQTVVIVTISSKSQYSRIKGRALFMSEFSGNLPHTLSDTQLVIEKDKFTDKYKYMVQHIIIRHIEDKQKFSSIKFRKLFSFSYEDGAEMYTLGGIIDEESRISDVEKLFPGNDFINADIDHITIIDVPILTYKEKLYLDSRIFELKTGVQDKTDDEIYSGLMQSLMFEMESPNALKSYIKYCRYFPQYYEGII